MLPICKHNIIRYTDYIQCSLQIGNISSISDKLENLNSHFLNVRPHLQNVALIVSGSCVVKLRFTISVTEKGDTNSFVQFC
jgi:hypothetical protein